MSGHRFVVAVFVLGRRSDGELLIRRDDLSRIKECFQRFLNLLVLVGGHLTELVESCLACVGRALTVGRLEEFAHLANPCEAVSQLRIRRKSVGHKEGKAVLDVAERILVNGTVVFEHEVH